MRNVDENVDESVVEDKTRREFLMGWEDKLENKTQETKGEAKEHLGKATGDDQMEADGTADKAKGNLKQAGEKVKDAFKKD